MALLPAEAVLFVLLLALGVGDAVVGAAALAGRLETLAIVGSQLVVHGYVEEVVCLVGACVAGFLTLWKRGGKKSMLVR